MKRLSEITKDPTLILRLLAAAGMIGAVYELGGGWWTLFTVCVWFLIPARFFKD